MSDTEEQRNEVYKFSFVNKYGQTKYTFSIAETMIRAIEIMQKKHSPVAILSALLNLPEQ